MGIAGSRRKRQLTLLDRTPTKYLSAEEMDFLAERFLGILPEEGLEEEAVWFTRELLMSYFAEIAPYLKGTSLCDQLFRTADANGDGRVDFSEFTAMVGVVARGSTDDKLELAFRLFDANSSGQVNVSDVVTMVEAVGTFLSSVASGMLHEDEFSAARRVVAEKLFENEPVLSLVEFKKRAMRNKAVVAVYSVYEFFFRPSIAAMDAHFGRNTVFGRALPDVVEHEKTSVPRVITQCTKFIRAYGLAEKGLFRIAVDMTVQVSLVDLVDREDQYDIRSILGPMHVDDAVHAAACLIKFYLRSLPEPVLTYVLYQEFLGATALDEAKRVQRYSELVALLPRANRDLLHHLLPFLREVADHPDNLMGIKNVATIFSPCLLQTKENRPEDVLRDIEATVTVASDLISFQKAILSVDLNMEMSMWLEPGSDGAERMQWQLKEMKYQARIEKLEAMVKERDERIAELQQRIHGADTPSESARALLSPRFQVAPLHGASQPLESKSERVVMISDPRASGRRPAPAKSHQRRATIMPKPFTPPRNVSSAVGRQRSTTAPTSPVPPVVIQRDAPPQ